MRSRPKEGGPPRRRESDPDRILTKRGKGKAKPARVVLSRTGEEKDLLKGNRKRLNCALHAGVRPGAERRANLNLRRSRRGVCEGLPLVNFSVNSERWPGGFRKGLPGQASVRIAGSTFYSESLILAQNERWRRG